MLEVIDPCEFPECYVAMLIEFSTPGIIPALAYMLYEEARNGIARGDYIQRCWSFVCSAEYLDEGRYGRCGICVLICFGWPADKA
jgi:hypothetical protein